MKIATTILFLLSFCLGCRKNRLDNNYNGIEGKWKWVYTKRKSLVYPYYDTIYRNGDFSIEFTKNAKIRYFSDANCFRSQVMKKISSTMDSYNGASEIIIYPTSGDSLFMHRTFKGSTNNTNQVEDTLFIGGMFPVKSNTQVGLTYYYSNVFIKEK